MITSQELVHRDEEMASVGAYPATSSVQIGHLRVRPVTRPSMMEPGQGRGVVSVRLGGAVRHGGRLAGALVAVALAVAVLAPSAGAAPAPWSVPSPSSAPGSWQVGAPTASPTPTPTTPPPWVAPGLPTTGDPAVTALVDQITKQAALVAKLHTQASTADEAYNRQLELRDKASRDQATAKAALAKAQQDYDAARARLTLTVQARYEQPTSRGVGGPAGRAGRGDDAAGRPARLPARHPRR